MYRSYGKRAFDVLIAMLALPMVCLAGVVVAVAIAAEDRGPVLYRAQRRGRRGEAFTMYKFRSMVVHAPDVRNADGSTYAGADDLRVTRVGRFLRKTSADELPQIVNVLRGDMSIVGPRPNMAGQTYELLGSLERKRLEVRPGITGLTQARYRNSASTRIKYETDSYYVEHLSFLLDLRILAATVIAVIAARNVNSVASVDDAH